MNLNDALNRIIDDGIEAAKRDYDEPDQEDQLKGAIQGFSECRGKNPQQIKALMLKARRDAQEAFHDAKDHYWFWRCRCAEIEWVANVLSCIMVAQDWPAITIRSYRGMMKAAEIIGTTSNMP